MITIFDRANIRGSREASSWKHNRDAAVYGSLIFFILFFVLFFVLTLTVHISVAIFIFPFILVLGGDLDS
jgi:hypothetical protein